VVVVVGMRMMVEMTRRDVKVEVVKRLRKK
jgi:hypothetical protein